VGQGFPWEIAQRWPMAVAGRRHSEGVGIGFAGRPRVLSTKRIYTLAPWEGYGAGTGFGPGFGSAHPRGRSPDVCPDAEEFF
jgi:hypothetical protein